MTVHIAMAEALPKMLAALDTGQLQCQQPKFTGGGCLYSGPCVVGSALDEADRKVFDQGSTFVSEGIGKLRQRSFFTTDFPAGSLPKLQKLHDSNRVPELRAEIVKLIGVPA